MSLGSKERGCGTRAKGGIYLECGSGGGFGLPLYSLIQDPVMPVDPDELGLQAVGVKFFELEGVWHILDIVGEKHYPNAADFLEEMVRLGLSRRISRNEDFSLLTPESRIFLVHPKAYINPVDAVGLREVPPFVGGRLAPCPTGKHKPAEQCDCAGLLWHVLTGDVEDAKADGMIDRDDEYPEWAPEPLPVKGPGFVTRSMPSFSYVGRPAPEGVRLSHGIIASCPIERIAVINDDNDTDGTREALDKAGAAHLPVRLENE